MSFLIFGLNAFVSFILFALGAGVASGFHKAMGLWFLVLNVVALLLFFYAPTPKPITRTLFFVGVVPLEIASIVVAAFICDVLGYRC